MANLPQTPVEQTICKCGATRHWREFHTGYSFARHWTNADGQPQGNAHRACPECGNAASVTEILDYNLHLWMVNDALQK